MTISALALCGVREPLAAGKPSASVLSPVEFHSETVRIAIGGDSVEVTGLYRFLTRRSALGSATILYPFPVDGRLGGARMVSVEVRAAGAGWRPLPFSGRPDLPGAVWRLPTDWGDTLEVRGVYRQALRGRFARYIVTTTSSWSRPLESARFEITLPDGARPERFSHAFRASRLEGRRVYVFEARGFRPDRDIEVEWRP